jgi:hypothetical protein
LDDALRGGEAARGSHILNQRFDVGTEELERSMAALADQVKVTRLAVRMLEPEATFAEVDFPCNAGVHHPLQGSVDGGAANPLIFATDQINQVVGAEMSLLAQEDIDNLFSLAGPFAPGGLEACEILKGGHSQVQTQK